MPTSYDHWKTTDPSDDGTSEARDEIGSQIQNSSEQLMEISKDLLDDRNDLDVLALDWFDTLASAGPAMDLIARGITACNLPLHEADTFARLCRLTTLLRSNRDEAVAEEADRRFEKLRHPDA